MSACHKKLRILINILLLFLIIFNPFMAHVLGVEQYKVAVILLGLAYQKQPMIYQFWFREG